MPTVDPIKYIIDALSTLTHGLIADIQTLILGILLLSFIGMGTDMLLSLFGSAIGRRIALRESERFSQAAENFKYERDSLEKGTFAYEQMNLAYKKMLNKSTDSLLKTYNKK